MSLPFHSKENIRPKTSGNMLTRLLGTCQWVVEGIGTILYREMLKRNTLQPLRRIIKESDRERRRRLLRDWARQKSNESSYIQLAVCGVGPPRTCSEPTFSLYAQGGFLFTTVASCLQWPGTASGHWSATALFYTSMLTALLAIVTGSQQLLLLPNERHTDQQRDVTGADAVLPQQVLLKPVDRADTEMEEAERRHLDAIAERIGGTEELRWFQMFVLQVPIMLLSIAVIEMLAAVCSVVLAPLAAMPVFDDQTKVSRNHCWTSDRQLMENGYRLQYCSSWLALG